MESGMKDTENYTIRRKVKLEITKMLVTFVEHAFIQEQEINMNTKWKSNAILLYNYQEVHCKRLN